MHIYNVAKSKVTNSNDFSRIKSSHIIFTKQKSKPKPDAF